MCRTLLGHENCCVAGHWRTVAQHTSSQTGTMNPDGSVVLHRRKAAAQAHALYAASQSSHVHSRMSLGQAVISIRRSLTSCSTRADA